MTAVRVIVEGRVQGVGYRAWTRREADARRIAGWVRNRAGGSVEAVFVGPPEQVEAMIAACRQGPRHAVVDSVTVTPEVERVFAGFEIRATAL